MYHIFIYVLSVLSLILFALHQKRENMLKEATKKIPDILGQGKLEVPEIQKRLYSDGVRVSIWELYNLLWDLVEKKVIQCTKIPMYHGRKIISHGAYELDTVTNHTS